MQSEFAVGYKRLVPTGPGTWRSPVYHAAWTDNQLISTRGPGIHALFNPHDNQLLDYWGCLVTIQSGENFTVGEIGFTCERATIIDYDENEARAILRFCAATLIEQTAIAIVCAMQVYKEPVFTAWASHWLSGEDQTRQSAEVAEAAAEAWAARGAAWAAAWAAEAEAAAERAAAWAARAAEAEAAEEEMNILLYAVNAVLGHE